MNMVFVLAVVILLHCACITGAKIAGESDKKCPEQFCRNGGKCKWMDNGFECDCTKSFTGKHCDTPVALVQCPSDHCQHGGSCESTPDGFICHCTEHYTGSLCDSLVSCPSDHCQNAGTCESTPDGFICHCSEHYTDPLCGSLVQCPSDHCQNGGTCESTPDGFICHCMNDYTGSLCEVPPTPATSCNEEDVCEGDGITVIPPEQCSFPFTSGYKIYYSCAENIDGVTDSTCAPLGCFTANRTAARCCKPGDYTAVPVSYDVLVAGQLPVSTQSIDGWIIIMSRTTKHGHWNRTWAEYRDGFGTIDTDFWLGLERMHALTSSNNYRMRIDVSEGDYFGSLEYWSFAVGDAASFYTLKADGYAPNELFPYDPLNPPTQISPFPNVGMGFSTYDADHDLVEEGSCAATYGCGYWFGGCGSLFTTCDHMLSFSTARMMIKRQ